MIIIDKPGLRLLQHAGHFHEHAVWTVDQDVVDPGIFQQGLQRAKASDFINHVTNELVHVLAGKRCAAFRDVLYHRTTHCIVQPFRLDTADFNAFFIQPLHHALMRGGF